MRGEEMAPKLTTPASLLFPTVGLYLCVCLLNLHGCCFPSQTWNLLLDL